MTPADFASTYRHVADGVSAGTGIDPIALLTQWANETAWGTSWAGAPYNLGNIESQGRVIHYPSFEAFIADCIATFHNGRYDAVLNAANAVDQIAAIVASPWSASHYGGSLSAFYSQLEAYELTPEEHGWLLDLHNTFNPSATATGGVGVFNETWAQFLISMKAQIDAIAKAGGALTASQAAQLTHIESMLTTGLAITETGVAKGK